MRDDPVYMEESKSYDSAVEKKKSDLWSRSPALSVCVGSVVSGRVVRRSEICLVLIAYLIIGFDSFRGLRDRFMKKQFLTEYTLMILATVGSVRHRAL